MMNKSKIDWCDFSWNPVTGCRHDCEYCYARKQARRFSGDTRLNLGSSQIKVLTYESEPSQAKQLVYELEKPFKNSNGRVIPFPAGFEPTLHEYRLQMPAQKKKPANIFVCSMADLFGVWVPDEWILRVFDACEAAPWHNYLFLTKNPTRYEELSDKGLLPKAENMWYGSTATTPETKIFCASQYRTFVSVEPIKKEFGTGSFPLTDWVIVGAETGKSPNKTKPRREWIENILKAESGHAPVLLKHSEELEAVMGEDLLQEWPEQLKHPEDKPIPHCSACEHCTNETQGKRGVKHICEIGWSAEANYTDRTEARHVPGRYARTSPEWCPLRKEEQE